MSDAWNTTQPPPDPYLAKREDTWMYERQLPTLLNVTLSANTDRFLSMPSTAPTRLAAVQVSTRLEVLTGTGRLLVNFLDPQGLIVWSFAAQNGTGPQQDTALLPIFGGRMHISTSNTFGGAFTVGTTIFVSGYLRAGLRGGS